MIGRRPLHHQSGRPTPTVPMNTNGKRVTLGTNGHLVRHKGHHNGQSSSSMQSQPGPSTSSAIPQGYTLANVPSTSKPLTSQTQYVTAPVAQMADTSTKYYVQVQDGAQNGYQIIPSTNNGVTFMLSDGTQLVQAMEPPTQYVYTNEAGQLVQLVDERSLVSDGSYIVQSPVGQVGTSTMQMQTPVFVNSLPTGGGFTVAQTMDTRVKEEEPLYVNARQYHMILKRRAARAKLEQQGRIPKQRQKYLHESRHQHALQRVRGEGGKFDSNAPCASGSTSHVRADKSTLTPVNIPATRYAPLRMRAPEHSRQADPEYMKAPLSVPHTFVNRRPPMNPHMNGSGSGTSNGAPNGIVRTANGYRYSGPGRISYIPLSQLEAKMAQGIVLADSSHEGSLQRL